MNLGFPEMLFIFLLALIIFGPKKLPEIGRQVGKALAEFKRASNEFKYQLESEMQQLDGATGRDAAENSIANGIGRAVSEFQRVSGEVRSRFENGMRDLEGEPSTSSAGAPNVPVANAPDEHATASPADAVAAPPAQPESAPPAKGADA